MAIDQGEIPRLTAPPLDDGRRFQLAASVVEELTSYIAGRSILP